MSSSSNKPQLVKLKKSSQEIPDWLFPVPSHIGIESPVRTMETSKGKKKRAKEVAKSLLERRAAGEIAKLRPSSQLLDIVEAYLDEIEYFTASEAFRKERNKHGDRKEDEIVDNPSLTLIFHEWQKSKGLKSLENNERKKVDSKKMEKPENNSKILNEEVRSALSIESNSSKIRSKKNVEKTNFDENKKISSKLLALPRSDPEANADDRKEKSPHKLTNLKTLKSNSRKRKASTPNSHSSSDSSSDDSKPRLKKAKLETRVNDVSKSSGSSSSSNDTMNTSNATKTTVIANGSNSSKDDLTSESESNSGGKHKRVEAEKNSNSSSSDSVSSSSNGDSSSSDGDSSSSDGDSSSSDSDSSSSDSDSSSSNNDSSSSEGESQTSTISSIKKNSPKSDSISDSGSGSGASSKSDSDSDSFCSNHSVNSRNIQKTLHSSSEKNSPKAPKQKPSKRSPKLYPDQDSTKTPAKVKNPNSITTLPTDAIKSQKTPKQPFSRIPKDIEVDERLASNAYVPYDYAQKAHEDLSVTRGKGFTKEKNKKKRGSYRGGYIDINGKKGIKFDE